MTHAEPRRDLAAAREPVSRIVFALVGGPVAWTVHFLGSYALVGIGCPAGWSGIHTAVAVFTMALAAVAIASTVAAYRAWRRSSGGRPWDVALTEPGGWLQFLLHSGVLLGAASAFVILLQGFSSLIVPACPVRAG